MRTCYDNNSECSSVVDIKFYFNLIFNLTFNLNKVEKQNE